MLDLSWKGDVNDIIIAVSSLESDEKIDRHKMFSQMIAKRITEGSGNKKGTILLVTNKDSEDEK